MNEFGFLQKDPNLRTRALDVFVSNFDQGLAGRYFLNAFYESPSGNFTLNWIFQPSTDPASDLIDRIEHGRAWASVYMNAGTTDRLNNVVRAVLNGDASTVSYHPSSAVTIVFDEGRNFNTINGFVLPPIRAAIATTSARYAAYLQSQATATATSQVTVNNVVAATALANITHSPIAYTNVNLHPAVPYASILATTLGYLFLWLIMTALVNVNIRLTQPLVGQVKIIDIVIIRIVNTVLNGLIISLIYTLCVLWFANFTRAVPFIRFWLFNWLAAITFTAIISLFTINLGALAQVLLTLFLITNLSASTTNVAIELQNRFYRVGYGLPLYHCFNAGRHLLFGSYTRLNVDIAVLFAYYFGAVILLLVTGIYRMRKQEKQVREKNREAQLKKKGRPIPRQTTKKK